MTNRSEIFRTRTILPVALGIAIGIVAAAAALASAPAHDSVQPVAASSQAAAPNGAMLLPLSAQPGIRFVRATAGAGDLCVAARREAGKPQDGCVH